jgi:hypothetical protein
LKKEIKVAQLAGYVSENSAYHHGEQSLYDSIIGMAQDYVGSNNIELLEPKGQFGSRLCGGKDSASPRYIFTNLSELTFHIFNPLDNPLLEYNEDDGKKIEPLWYIPIVPLILINGSDGIGTGFSTKVPPHDPELVVKNLLNMIDNVKIKNMPPFQKLEFKDVEYKINQIYSDINHKYSSAFDILASYLKGHKIIYMEAKYYCEIHLNFYMLPSILFSTAATVLSSYVSNFIWGPVFISALNGVIAFLLAIVNYLKLDAASEAHKTSAHQYDKLQSSVVFTSGSVLLFRNFNIEFQFLKFCFSWEFLGL